MDKISILLLITLNFSSCRHNNLLYIEGNVRNIDSRKVYLTEASNISAYVDSADYSEHRFLFKIPVEQYSGRLVSVVYVDSNNNKVHALDFTNHILSSKNQRYSYNAFNIGKENISMDGIANVREDSIEGTHIKIRIDSIAIKAGIETDALYRTQMMNFGYLEGDVSTRTHNLNDYLSIIHQYPASQYLLSKLDENKAVLSKVELEAMLGAFKKESLLSPIGTSLTFYTRNKSAASVLKNFKLNDGHGNSVEIINHAAKINMIVLWASWCGPCRQEIPTLKRLYSKYHEHGLSVTSISIDKDIRSWKTALASEQMNWLQLIVPDSLKKSFSAEYEISSIPEIIFTDASGVVLQRAIGFKSNGYSIYETIIRKELGGL